MLTLLASTIVVAGVVMLWPICLAPPLFGYTLYLYLVAWALPPAVVFARCATSRPEGMIVPSLIVLLVASLAILTLLGPVAPDHLRYRTMTCSAVSQSGVTVHGQCVCESEGSDAIRRQCTYDGLIYSPFVWLTDRW